VLDPELLPLLPLLMPELLRKKNLRKVLMLKEVKKKRKSLNLPRKRKKLD
jgi:hypothetical protein